MEISRLGTPESYLTSLAKELQPKRDYLASVLAEVGMKPVVPQGGYFMMADYSNLGQFKIASMTYVNFKALTSLGFMLKRQQPCIKLAAMRSAGLQAEDSLGN